MAKKKLNPDDLRPGDTLLYRPTSFFGYCIAFLTAGRVSHVEGYKGGGISYASRDGLGVNEYPLRLDGLVEVRCSAQPLNLGDLAREFQKHQGDAYDIGTIANFLTFGGNPRLLNALGRAVSILSFGKIGWHRRAEVCSELWTILLRAGGLPDLFGRERAERITPRDFQKQAVLVRKWP